jgi:hypothetical protein
MSSVDGTITLQQAKAPLGPGEGRFSAECGAICRGNYRRLASQIGVDWFEQKNMLTSYFIFRGPAPKMIMFHEAVKQAEEESADD